MIFSFVGDRTAGLALALLCAVSVAVPAADADESHGGSIPRALPIPMPQFHGRLYIDAQTYNHTPDTIGDGMTVNNARLSASGGLPGNLYYLLEYDFAHKEIKYAWMRFDGLAAGRIKAGQFKEPFSLEELTSTRFITFTDRALPNALVPGYRIGVGVKRRTPFWTAAVGVFNRPTAGYATVTGPDGSWAVTGRLTWSPVNRPEALLHLGVDGEYRLAGRGNTFHVRQGPETGQTETYYLDTGQVSGVDHFASLGVEAAATTGPWSAQAEYVRTHVARLAGAPSPNFQGAYAFVSWFATGESRNYRGGRFGRIHPRRTLGALQLAARYSFLDLNSGPVAGGRERDLTLGVNWYITPYTRVMFNYIKVHARTAVGIRTPNIFVARLQSDF